MTIAKKNTPKKITTHFSLLSIVVIFVLVLTVATIVRAQPPAGTPAGGSSRYDAVQAIDDVSTFTTTFSDVPGMSVPFAVSGSGSKPVVVTFNARPSPLTGNFGSCVFIARANIDGTHLSPTFTNENTGSDASFSFVMPSVSSGQHIAKLQWKALEENPGINPLTPSCATLRSLTVLHE